MKTQSRDSTILPKLKPMQELPFQEGILNFNRPAVILLTTSSNIKIQYTLST
jgi:hypothetical protein